MRICIDCRAASHPQRGGYKTYVENLLFGLSQIDTSHEYLLFLDRDIGGRDLPRPMNSSIGIVSNDLPVIGALLREQILLPRGMLAAGCDLAHFPCNTGPLAYKGRYIVTVHDLTSMTSTPSLPERDSFGTTWRYLIVKYTALNIPRLASRAAAVITVSNYARRQIVERLGVPGERVFITPLAPSSLYDPLEERALASARAEIKRSFGIQEPYVLAVGERRSKNIAGVFQAFKQMNDTLRATHIIVVVVAAVAYRQVLEKAVRSSGLEERVILLGSQPPEKLLLLYNCAEVFAFPSFEESFGLPVVEAMACGTPVVASNAAAVPETAGGAAILIDPRETTTLAAALERVLRDRNLRQRLERAGLERVSRLSWEKTAKQTVRVYEDPLNIPRRWGRS